MIGYSTVQDIENVISTKTLAQITDDLNGLVVVEEIVLQSIKDSDTIINSYCSARYPVPFEVIPDLIRQISRDLSIVALYMRRFQLEMPESLKIQRSNALSMLDKIQKGEIDLVPKNDTKSSRLNVKSSPRMLSSMLESY